MVKKDFIKITKKLIKLGCKQKDIANLFHVSQSTISIWNKKPLTN